MTRSSYGVRFVAVFLALALTMFAVGFSWAVVDDYARQRVLPQGVSIEGVDVGGIPRAAAVARIRTRLVAPLQQPMSWSFRGQHLALDPSAIVSVDVERIVESVLAKPDRTTLLERVYRRATGQPVRVTVRLPVKVDRRALHTWVSGTAKAIKVAPVDARLVVVGNGVRISPSRTGSRLDQKKAEALLVRALATGGRSVHLPIAPVKPKVTEDAFDQTLLVHLNQRRVWLFEKTRLVKSYRIAVGQPEWPTPQGRYHVISKDEWPTWTNPGSGWASGMPASIPGGPGNPLGSREIAIDAAGIRFHGTQNDGSIGEAASHGCMRMHEWDVQDLYPRVKVGADVIIVP